MHFTARCPLPTLLSPSWLERLGTCLVSRQMLVRLQPSALLSRWCNGKHRTLRRSGSRFKSGLGYLPCNRQKAVQICQGARHFAVHATLNISFVSFFTRFTQIP